MQTCTKNEMFEASENICSVNLHIWTGFGGRYMPCTHTCGQKAVQRETTKKFSSSGQNEFLQRLPEKAACNEHCTIDFTVKVKDRTAPVHFFLNK